MSAHDGAANVTVDEPIACPKCGSTNWYCFDERSRPCWDSEGHQVSTVVIGGLGCNDCKATWLHYSVPPPDDEDCDCEGWDD